MPIVSASAFAYPQDVKAYENAISGEATESEALAVGDSGKGKWGDDTTCEDVPMCALPPEDCIDRWGSSGGARGKKVVVIYNGVTVVGELRDVMPSKMNIRNGAGIDLNPGFAKAFGVEPPFMLKDVEWRWQDAGPG